MTGPDATILAFDTSAAHCAAALLMQGTIVALRVDAMAVGQAEHLIPLLEQMLGDNRLGWSDLTTIGVGIGPGNFTGIRIGVSAARGLALGLGIPAIGVSAFDAAAYALQRPVTVTLPAPRGMVYRQTLYSKRADPPETVEGSAIAQPADMLVTAIARIVEERAGQNWPRPAPLYMRGADAAPARDPAPTILT